MLDAAPVVRSTAIRQPLSLGELLDRAITLIVRRLALWLGLFAAVALPLALCSHVSSHDGAPSPATLFDLATKGRFATADVVPLALAQVALGAVAYPLAIACAIFLVDRACDAGPLSIRAGVARAIRRLLTIYAVALLWSLAVSLAATAASFAVVGVGGLASRVPQGNDVVQWIEIIGTATFGLGAVAVCYAVVETQNPLVALQRAVVRIARKGEIVRAMIVGDVVLVVAATATGIAAGFGEPLDEALNVPIGSATLGLLGSIVVSVVCCSFVALYARDVRMRRDGSDLDDAVFAIASPIATGRPTPN